MEALKKTIVVTTLLASSVGAFQAPFLVKSRATTSLQSTPEPESSEPININNNNINNDESALEGTDRRNFLIRLGGISSGLLIAAAGPTLASTRDNGIVVFGEESIMDQKTHGTTEMAVQEDLRYGVSRKVADRICSYNRHFAEFGGYFLDTSFEDVVRSAKGPLTFYDSVTGSPLFQAPIGRSAEDFIAESEKHGWPSFRDQEVMWENVRVLRGSGETVSVAGTHLGHNIPDKKGNRYCINLVSIAGNPASQSA